VAGFGTQTAAVAFFFVNLDNSSNHLTGSPFLGIQHTHNLFIHFINYAFAGMLAPLHAAEGIVVGDKTAVLAGHLGVDGEQLNFMSALGADLFNNRRGFGFGLASVHNHKVTSFIFRQHGCLDFVAVLYYTQDNENVGNPTKERQYGKIF
jgi:hypothetical protein